MSQNSCHAVCSVCEQKPAAYFPIRDDFSKHGKETSELMKFHSAKLIGKIFHRNMLDNGVCAGVYNSFC